MRILYAIFCVWLWTSFLQSAINSGITIPDNMVFLTMSIIAAGALAGGD